MKFWIYVYYSLHDRYVYKQLTLRELKRFAKGFLKGKNRWVLFITTKDPTK